MSSIWSQIEIAGRDCDDSAAHVADSLGAKKIEDAATAASDAEAACVKAGFAIGKITPPALIDVSASDALHKAVKVCEEAYLMRSGAYRQLSENLEGEGVDLSSSELKRRQANANGQAALCAKDFHDLALLTGASLGD